MHAVQGQYARRRILPREMAGEKQAALEESIELRYQICYLFKALGKQEKYKRLQGVCDDASWLMQQFAGMLDVPKYALMKTCPRVEGENFSFHPVSTMASCTLVVMTTASRYGTAATMHVLLL